MKLSRELKTGIIVLGGILLFILGFTYLKSSSLFETSRIFYAVYDDVNGLTTGTPVNINGYQVGKIKSIDFFDNQGKLLVSFTVEKSFEFGRNSEAQIYDTGIIGGKSLKIIPSFDGGEMARSGDTLRGNIQPGLTELVTQKLTPLQEKLEQVLMITDSVLVSVDEVLDEEAKGNLRKSMAHLEEITRNFRTTSVTVNSFMEDNREKLDASLDNVAHLSGNLASLSDTLAEANIGAVIADLSKTSASLNAMLSKVEQGEGSLGKLMNDDKLYSELTGASAQLDLLLEDMRLNPKRYVHFSLFGKKAAPYQEPEEQN